jgi:hypothetical protein
MTALAELESAGPGLLMIMIGLPLLVLGQLLLAAGLLRSRAVPFRGGSPRWW